MLMGSVLRLMLFEAQTNLIENCMSDKTKEQAAKDIARFVERFDGSYRLLARYAALPLVLTPELLNYLHSRFLYGQVAWVAEADLLLSELCRRIGYEQYVMDAAVRAHLIAEMRKEDDGELRMKEVASLLISYTEHLARTNPFISSQELKAQQWAAMVCLNDQRVEAIRQIIEAFQKMVPPSGMITEADRIELLNLTELTKKLAPQLEAHPELIEYARSISEFLRQPVINELSPQQQPLNEAVVIEGLTLPAPNSIYSANSVSFGSVKNEREQQPKAETFDRESSVRNPRGSVFRKIYEFVKDITAPSTSAPRDETSTAGDKSLYENKASSLALLFAGQSEEISGDVIFVHGIDGDIYRTWAVPEGGEKVHWAKWLAETRHDLRFWTLGYPASPFLWTGRAMPLQDRAINLLALLKANGIGKRPVCFIAHSMGGMLVKQMVRMAFSGGTEEYTQIGKSVRGVVFLSTPHTGSDLTTLMNYLKLIQRKGVAFEDLRDAGALLRDLNLWYINHVERLGIMNKVFFGTGPKFGNTTVDNSSSTGFIKGATPILIDANHNEICKPTSKESLVYKATSNFVNEVIPLTKTEDRIHEINNDITANAYQPSQPIEIFFSYSHSDEVLKDKLVTHLSTLRRSGVIESWHDRQITADAEWMGSIDKHLESARIILLLTSPDFLASDYCYDIEMARAMERHTHGTARVIPIILRNCSWQDAPFGKLQALPKNAKPVKNWKDMDEAFIDVVAGIKKAIAEMNLGAEEMLNQIGFQVEQLEINLIIRDYHGNCDTRWNWRGVRTISQGSRPRIPGRLRFYTPGASISQFPSLSREYNERYMIEYVEKNPYSCEFYIRPKVTSNEMSYEYTAEISKAFIMNQEDLVEYIYKYEWFGFYISSVIETLTMNIYFPAYYRPNEIQLEACIGPTPDDSGDGEEIKRVNKEGGLRVESNDVLVTVKKPKIGYLYFVRWRPLPKEIVVGLNQRF
jgi:pimeloyl-ACP methyl ester carboxylesterase